MESGDISAGSWKGVLHHMKGWLLRCSMFDHGLSVFLGRSCHRAAGFSMAAFDRCLAIRREARANRPQTCPLRLLSKHDRLGLLPAQNPTARHSYRVARAIDHMFETRPRSAPAILNSIPAISKTDTQNGTAIVRRRQLAPTVQARHSSPARSRRQIEAGSRTTEMRTLAESSEWCG